MQLNKHIKTGNISIVIDCFQIIKTYLDNKITIITCDYLFKDKIIYKQFIDWVNL